MSFNENTRVKIPAILHLYKLGYKYLSLTKANRDESTNIFTDIFTESIVRINPGIDEDVVKRVFETVSLALDNEDLGQVFYNMLTATSGTRLIDFKNFDNNSFHVVTELTCKNGDDEFRPSLQRAFQDAVVVWVFLDGIDCLLRGHEVSQPPASGATCAILMLL